jgi:hypothetical protein
VAFEAYHLLSSVVALIDYITPTLALFSRGRVPEGNRTKARADTPFTRRIKTWLRPRKPSTATDKVHSPFVPEGDLRYLHGNSRTTSQQLVPYLPIGVGYSGAQRT